MVTITDIIPGQWPCVLCTVSLCFFGESADMAYTNSTRTVISNIKVTMAQIIAKIARFYH
jgi:hypothetical protein